MPRERVQHGKIWVTETQPEVDGVAGAVLTYEYDPEKALPENTTLDEDPSLDVTWGKDASYVQVSIDIPRERWFAITKDLEDDPSIIKRAIYTMPLSRYEINKLIKTLRRARDAAHGKDE